MNNQDYYETLGVDKQASADDIKSAYRKLAKKYHPDISKEANAEEKFKEVQEAYAILSDENKRRQYDQFGSAAFANGSSGGGFGGFQGFQGGFDDVDLGDIFGNMFGSSFGFGSSGSKNTNSRVRGEDSIIRMKLSFEEAIYGSSKDITISITDTCKDCDGAGGFSEHTCSECHGSGTVTSEQRTILGSFLTKTTCPSCQGKGKTYETVCSSCHGKGTVKSNKTLTIKIPSGVDSGNRLRLPGKGNAGKNGGPNGDLYIEFTVSGHDFYERDGDDIYLEVPITITEALLGTKKEIPTISGNVKLVIPAGSMTGDKQRLRGKGIDNESSHHKGDMYTVLKVEVPSKLNKIQKHLVEELNKTDIETASISKFNKFVDKN
ncbi:MAG: molecular chaperone DnaJ [Bacilli bacterium]